MVGDSDSDAVGGEGDGHGDGKSEGDGNGRKRSPRRRWMALAAAGAVVVLAAVAVVLALGGDDDSAPEDDAATASTTTSTTAPTTTTTAPTTTTTTAPPPVAMGVDGVFEMQLPSTWASIGVSGDMHGRGVEMFPGDAEHADLADMVLDSLVTPQTVFIAMDGSRPAEITQSDLLLVETGPGNVDVDTAYAAAKDYTSAEPVAEGRVTTPVGEAPWFEFAGPGGLYGRRYVISANGIVWQLTYWSSDQEHRAAEADAAIASFTPTAA